MYLKNKGPYSPFDDTVLQRLDASYLRWRRIDRRVDQFLLILLLALVALVCALFIDSRQTMARSPIDADPRDFATLLAINPDTVAWLAIDGTSIEDPVVQGKDNFEYLDKGFDGDFYAGGTLFLDAANTRDLSDRYNIIHGHHMAGDEMFGCLERYLDESWFWEHRSGELRTPNREYDLQLIAAGIYNAYDSEVYAPGDSQPLGAIRRSTIQAGARSTARTSARITANDGAPMNGEEQRIGRDSKNHKNPSGRRDASDGRSTSDGDPEPCIEYASEHSEKAGASQILALSTCAGDMSDDRIVVFWKMTERREHDGEYRQAAGRTSSGGGTDRNQ